MKYPIVKPYLPSLVKYQEYVTDIFARNYLTNNGPLVQELEQRLTEYLGVEYLLLVTNGTLALQVAYAALNIEGKVLTTPFSFAATASSLCWQKFQVEFVDIDAKTLNLDVNNISVQQWQNASAILPVHVFGNPCEVESMRELAKKYNVKVIYDAAHAFGSDFNGQSVLNYGDAATLSFHATKLFHSVEGGAIIFKSKEHYEKAKQLINFGFDENYYPEFIGINAKMSEIHAAMGLVNLASIDEITIHRHALACAYHIQLKDVVTLQQWHDYGTNNGAYMPIILSSETELIKVMNSLSEQGIQTRRYFYPSLSQVNIYGQKGLTPIANDISLRILCLPMYFDLSLADINVICNSLKNALQSLRKINE